MNVVIEHYIQKDILRSLSHADHLRFSELKPTGLANNIFMYHLKQVISAGLVAKKGDSYILTPDGFRYIDRATRTNLDLRPQPKLISLLVIGNDAGEYIMYPRHAQPFMGRLVVPSGRLHFGENIDEHILRELKEKIGLTLAMKYQGTASIQISQDGEVLTHVYAHLLHCSVKGRPALRASDPRFVPQWIDIRKVDADFIMPGTLEVVDHIKHKDSSFLDLKLSHARSAGEI